MVSLDQFKQTYITECFELLGDMESLLLELNVDEADLEQLNAIFRCAHSIKGGAGAFGLDSIMNFTHVLEALLDSMREGKVKPSTEAVNMLLKSVDIVTKMVRAAQDNVPPPDGCGSELLVQLKKLAAGSDVVKESIEVSVVDNNKENIVVRENQWQINFAPHETLLATGNEPLLILRELASLGKAEITAFTHRVPLFEELDPTCCYIGWSILLHTDKPESTIREVFEFVDDHCDLVITMEVADSSNEVEIIEVKPNVIKLAPTEESAAKSVQATSIRVDLEKVDKLVNMVGELVITEAMLKAQTHYLNEGQHSDLMRGITELSQHTRELQEAVMAVRMQPVKSIFSRMPRIVRDISAQLGKEIRLLTSGENTEVDKTVIEQLGDPLTHMIRNSVDHGIEKPQTRIAAGKPEEGTIHLSAEHRGGRIVIEIRDDGAGINRSKVLAKAKEKGLVPIDVTPSDEECDNLIFLPGFSTADVVSNISGRGVGMDVVRRNIQSLGGTVRVTTSPGKGSLFTVSLPLTLAILDGMIVRVGVENYIIPITSIIETLRPKSEQVKRVEGHNDVINVRGDFVTIVYLHRIFNIKGAERDPSKALIVLVESGRKKMGVVVDELIGQQQVVIKSLESNTDTVAGVSGATILGDGRVSLILDIDGLDSLCHEQLEAVA
ncbi:MAG: chemotaxis protein CheA [Rickettsiales bacterium]|jgi:two-component system chemotaxis sensor kinase CheA